MQHYVSVQVRCSVVVLSRAARSDRKSAPLDDKQGKLHDESGVLDISETDALEKVERTLKDVKNSYTKAEGVLKKFYEDEEAGA